MDNERIFLNNLKAYLKIINNYLLKNNLSRSVSVKDSISKPSFKIPCKVQKKDYPQNGKIPIIDQGQSNIAGFTDNEECKISDTPIIIFGDHTRCFKFIDFDFAQGADGIKLLKPISDFYPRFFYYQLLSIDLENRGYSRHYKYLLSHTIILPDDIEIQKKIVQFLDDFRSNNLKNKIYFNHNIENKIKNMQNICLSLNSIKIKENNNILLIQKLRRSILQDAVSGKLVSQYPNDETASDLLNKIKKSKEKYSKQHRIKKEKELSLNTNSEMYYNIPKNWLWVRLGDIAFVVRGGSPRPAGDPRYYNGKIPFLKVADLTKDDNMYLKSYSYTIKEAGLFKTRMVDEDTLMLTNSGATLGVPKICCIKTTFNDGIAAFLGFNNYIYKPYLYYFLKQKTKWFLEVASRGQGQPNLNTDIIRNTLVPLPPLPEQKRIVQKVDKLMKLCDGLEQQVNENKKNAELLVDTVLREIFEN